MATSRAHRVRTIPRLLLISAALLILIPLPARAQKLLIVNPGCSDGGLQSWPGWSTITTVTSTDFLAAGCKGAYDVVEIACIDSNIIGPAGVQLIDDLVQGGVGLYSYKDFGNLNWVPPGGIASSGLDTCSDNLSIPVSASTHPIITFPTPDLTAADFVPVDCAIHGSYTGVPASYDAIATSNDTNNPVIIASNGTPGRVLIRAHHHHDLDEPGAVRLNDSIANWLLGSVPTGSDSDFDAVLDLCDNCPAAANAGQEDADNDQIGDACDNCVGAGADTDGDGLCDGNDNCPAVSNPGQEDSDFDGIGDACDSCVGFGAADTDGDGLCDGEDNCPNDFNPLQEDADFDGIGDVCDPCESDPFPFDFDFDGFCSSPLQCPAGCDNCPFDNNPGQEDTDGEGIGDACDNCPAVSNLDQQDSDFDGFGNACDSCVGPGAADMDADTICDNGDNCPNDPNPGQVDSDGDAVGDACDPCDGDPFTFDFDGDDFCGSPATCPAGCDNCSFTFNPDQADGDGDGDGNVCDNCPATPNANQQDSDFDGFGNACDFCVGPGPSDTDGDGPCDLTDNCPNDFNPGQEDGDGDDIGDPCDPCGEDPSTFDFDGDQFCSDPDECPAGCDNCPDDFNPSQLDGDFDGLGDTCDNCPAHANPEQEDADNDLAGDACDPCVGPGTVDADDDGICDTVDPCPNDSTLACATLFGCTGAGLAASTLYRINPLTGVGFPIGPMGIFGCNALAFDPTTHVLYAIGVDPIFFEDSLFTVNVSTGAASLVGDTGVVETNDIAFRSDEELFSYHGSVVRAGRLSKSTGNAILLGPSGLSFGNGGGITFDQVDTLLYADAVSLRTINQATGLTMLLSPLDFPPVACFSPRIESMETHASGAVYGVMNCSNSSITPSYLVTVGVPSGSVSAIAATVDGLDGIAFAPLGACGDGLQDLDEECDDGGILDGDCCSSTCQFEAAGEPCPGDGSSCTPDRCDGAGTCVSSPPTGCKQAGKSILLIKNKSEEENDRLSFKWLRGETTSLAELGDPQATTDYTLCVYTGPVMNPLFETIVPADAVKWGAVGTKGFKYKDPGADADGVTKMLVKSGDAGKTKAFVKGGGINLPFSAFSNLPLPVTARLVNEENACFAASFAAEDVEENDAGQFKAKKD